jgi:hypothetical protein
MSANPYDEMAQELSKHRYQTDPKPNAFTEEEGQILLHEHFCRSIG